MAALIVFAAQPLVSAEESTRSAVYLIEESHQLPNNSGTNATNVEATVFLFDNRLEYAGQHVLSEEIKVDDDPFSPTISLTEDNRIARFSFDRINSHSSKTITINQYIRVDHVDPIDQSDVQGEVPDNLSAYTQPIPNLWESDESVLVNKATELIEGQSNPYYQAKAIFDFVENCLTYEEQENEHSALWAYYNHVGDCSEFTHLFSALCRAVDIPTRFVAGYGYDPVAGGATGHAFAFIYLPGVGWTPADLTWNRPQGMFGELSNDHLIELTSDGGNLVTDNKIVIPGTGVKYEFVGTDPDISPASSYSITCLVAVEPTIYTASQLKDSTWRFSVDVTNMGTRGIENVRVELQADSTYFEVPPAEEVGTLGIGMHQMAYFDVRVKQTVQNSLVTAVVTYDSPYGKFRAESQLSASATLPSPPLELPIDLLIILACVVGGIIAVAVVLLRR